MDFKNSIDSLMHQAIFDSVFPGAVLLISEKNRILFHRAYGLANIFTKRPMTVKTLFDLASLTKPLATTVALMKLVNDNRINLEDTLDNLIPDFQNTDKASITIKNLLAHVSGYPDYRPYYKILEKLPFQQRRLKLRKCLLAEKIENSKTKMVYSDLGFMILAWIVEHISGNQLDRYISKTICIPLGLKTLNFIDLTTKKPAVTFAATEKCSWRKKILEGEVHDENAYVVGGIDGHAGLFGTAEEIWRLLICLINAYCNRINALQFKQQTVEYFLTEVNNTGRTLGFDMPSKHNSSAGRLFSPKSVGHLGFTGTSFWIDLDQFIQVILLTNRVHPGRQNEKIKNFRPRLHNTIMENLGQNGS
jgi:CubicO group peptidase (beta-lactamase class C family)